MSPNHSPYSITPRKPGERSIPLSTVGRHLLELVKPITDMCTLPETCEATYEYLETVTVMRTGTNGVKPLFVTVDSTSTHYSKKPCVPCPVLP